MQEFATLQTTDDVIDALGGNRAVGDLTASNAKAVSNWRGSKFPAWTYLSINRGLDAIGKSASASLWKMEAPKRQQGADA